MFILVELIMVLVLLWLIANVIRFFFFRDELGGGPLALSDKWIEQEEQKKSKKGGVK